MDINDIKRELKNLQQSYANTLSTIEERAAAARKRLYDNGTVSDHDAFNMAANCQDLAVLAGKIAQTENVIRWMGAL